MGSFNYNTNKTHMKTFIIAAMTGAAAAAYDYKNKGRYWEDQCRTGMKQSPINFDKSIEKNVGYLRADLAQFTNKNGSMHFAFGNYDASKKHISAEKSGANMHGAPLVTGFQKDLSYLMWFGESRKTGM